MNRMLPTGLALILFAAVAVAPCRAQSINSGVRDRANLFSSEAVRQAELALQAIERENHWQVLVETIDSLDGQNVRDRAIADAKARNLHGLIILVSKNDHKIFVEPSDSARKVFSKERTKAINDAMVTAFKTKDFDRGLRAAVIAIQNDLTASAPAAVGPVKAGVRDGAKMFSPDAVQKADQALQALQREARWQVVVETVDSLNGQNPRDRAIADAKKENLHGLIVLISKTDHKFYAEPSRSAELVFTKEHIKAINELLTRSFKEGKFDEGLLAVVAEVRNEAGLAPERTATRKGESPKINAPENAASKAVAAVAERRNETGLAPERTTTRAEEKPKAKESEDAASKTVAIAPLVRPAEAPASPSSAPPKAPHPVSELSKGPNMTGFILLGVGALFFVWLLSRAFRRPRQPTYGGPPQSAYGGQPQPVGPAPGYGPVSQPTAPPMGNPGYRTGPAGPPAANPGYAAGGYGYGAPQPPPHQPAGGGFMSGALGGLGGAIVGNILYDKFGHPHPAPEAHSTGHVDYSGGVAPPVHPGAGTVPPTPSETYDPNAGAGGDWGGGPEPAQPTSDWTGAGNAGAGGDWGTGATQEAPADTGNDWSGSGDAGAGGDWAAQDSTSGEDAGAGGDWGGSEPASGTDDAAGGDWGGGADDGGGGGDDQGQGGNW